MFLSFLLQIHYYQQGAFYLPAGTLLREGNMIKRDYKDRLFRRFFGGEDTKDNLLSLYNALNGTDYTSADDLTVLQY